MVETGAQILAKATSKLRLVNIPTPARDARRLLAYALQIPQARLTLNLDKPVSVDAQARFDRVIEARTGRKPVSQIVGKRAFFGHDFIVTPDVLDPRPETEILVQLALDTPANRILDLGTGSGAILLSVLGAREMATGLGTDISACALAVAARNAENLGVVDRADFAQGRWWSAVTGSFDLILSNPPYIAAHEMADLSPEVREHEPRIALTDGADGLSAYREILTHLFGFLSLSGTVILEIGPTQGHAVARMMTETGLTGVQIVKDLDNRDRVVMGQRTGR
jgi:release factor glutamine methyltransferase